MGCHTRVVRCSPMKPAILLARLLAGHVTNVRFTDAQQLLTALGFELVRVSASHHVYAQPGIVDQVNLQDRRGQA